MRFEYSGPVCGVNKKHAIVRGRMILTKKYRDFVTALTWVFHEKSRGSTIEDPVSVTISMWVHPAMDSDALLKPIFDALQHAGVIANDNQIRRYNVERFNISGADPELEIEVTELQPQKK